MSEQNNIPVPQRPGPAFAQTGPAGVQLTPRDMLLILRRHIWLMLSITIIGFVMGGTSWYLLRKYLPRYTAQTFIRVLSPAEKDPMTIGEHMVTKDIQYASRVSMAAIMKSQSTLARLIDRDKIQETKWFKAFGDIKSERIRKAVRELQKRFGASAQRDGEFIITSMTCADKEEAALVVNEMVDLFLAMRGSTKQKEVADRLTKLEDERTRVQRDLDAAETALTDVQNRWGFTDLEARDQLRSTMQVKLDDLELEQNKLLMEVRQLQAMVGTFEKQAMGPFSDQVKQQIESDQTMVALTRQVATLEASLAAVLTKFGENHRVIRQTQELINQTRKEKEIRKIEIAEQTRQSNLQRSQDQLVILQSRFEQLEKMRQQAASEKGRFDMARTQYQQRAKIRDERRTMLNKVKEQIEKLKIMHDDPLTPKVQFVGYAPAPLEISSPKWQLYFPGGTMLGLMAGLGLAFLIELLNDLVRTPRDVARFLHIPLLGVIPDAAEDDQVTDSNLYLTLQQAPFSVTSEAYRRFRTNLKLTSGESSKVLLVSSSMPADGKTSVAVNLALAFAADSKKLLLIDANFRQPNLHNIFPVQQQTDQPQDQAHPGLAELLAGRCSYSQTIRTSGIEGFDIIQASLLPANPAELLGGTNMLKLIKQARQNYDYIIIDGPPVLLVSDAKTLAKSVDGTILVFNAAATKRGAALRTIRELQQISANILGCVLLGVKALKGGYFQEQFRSYRKYQQPQPVRSS
ncbi:MAG TPA: polysaccharide biosynthesis tyrosine autokinase [Sedimentisphaerales bacterium]|nr:polysaccharide biosynthesis tyrosine autokinase [Sedimentisphaerales bacterium]